MTWMLKMLLPYHDMHVEDVVALPWHACWRCCCLTMTCMLKMLLPYHDMHVEDVVALPWHACWWCCCLTMTCMLMMLMPYHDMHVDDVDALPWHACWRCCCLTMTCMLKMMLPYHDMHVEDVALPWHACWWCWCLTLLGEWAVHPTDGHADDVDALPCWGNGPCTPLTGMLMMLMPYLAGGMGRAPHWRACWWCWCLTLLGEWAVHPTDGHADDVDALPCWGNGPCTPLTGMLMMLMPYLGRVTGMLMMLMPYLAGGMGCTPLTGMLMMLMPYLAGGMGRAPHCHADLGEWAVHPTDGHADDVDALPCWPHWRACWWCWCLTLLGEWAVHPTDMHDVDALPCWWCWACWCLTTPLTGMLMMLMPYLAGGMGRAPHWRACWWCWCLTLLGEWAVHPTDGHADDVDALPCWGNGPCTPLTGMLMMLMPYLAGGMGCAPHWRACWWCWCLTLLGEWAVHPTDGHADDVDALPCWGNGLCTPLTGMLMMLMPYLAGGMGRAPHWRACWWCWCLTLLGEWAVHPTDGHADDVDALPCWGNGPCTPLTGMLMMLMPYLAGGMGRAPHWRACWWCWCLTLLGEWAVHPTDGHADDVDALPCWGNGPCTPLTGMLMMLMPYLAGGMGRAPHWRACWWCWCLTLLGEWAVHPTDGHADDVDALPCWGNGPCTPLTGMLMMLMPYLAGGMGRAPHWRACWWCWCLTLLGEWAVHPTDGHADDVDALPCWGNGPCTPLTGMLMMLMPYLAGGMGRAPHWRACWWCWCLTLLGEWAVHPTDGHADELLLQQLGVGGGVEVVGLHAAAVGSGVGRSHEGLTRLGGRVPCHHLTWRAHIHMTCMSADHPTLSSTHLTITCLYPSPPPPNLDDECVNGCQHEGFRWHCAMSTWRV